MSQNFLIFLNAASKQRRVSSQRPAFNNIQKVFFFVNLGPQFNLKPFKIFYGPQTVQNNHTKINNIKELTHRPKTWTGIQTLVWQSPKLESKL
jgi:hypothetical protein